MATEGQHELVGLTIMEVVPISHDLLVAEGWDHNTEDPRPAMLILSDGTKVYPAGDFTGHNLGALYGERPSGELVHFEVEETEDAGR